MVWLCQVIFSEELKLLSCALFLNVMEEDLRWGWDCILLRDALTIFLQTTTFKETMKLFHGLEVMLVCGVHIVRFSFLLWGQG